MPPASRFWGCRVIAAASQIVRSFCSHVGFRYVGTRLRAVPSWSLRVCRGTSRVCGKVRPAQCQDPGLRTRRLHLTVSIRHHGPRCWQSAPGAQNPGPDDGTQRDQNPGPDDGTQRDQNPGWGKRHSHRQDPASGIPNPGFGEKTFTPSRPDTDTGGPDTDTGSPESRVWEDGPAAEMRHRESGTWGPSGRGPVT